MKVAAAEPLVKTQNVLYLTDFSDASEAALPFAIAMARKYEGSLEALHVLTPVIPESCPEAVRADQDLAEAEMRKIKVRLEGVTSAAATARESSVWAGVERAIRSDNIDLIVMGTHGRNGPSRLLLGSVAEEVFRRSPIPVLTVGPGIQIRPAGEIRFNRVLFATDFSAASDAALPYLRDLGHEKCQLLLLHVMRRPEGHDPGEQKKFELSVAKSIGALYKIVPKDAVFNPAEVAVEFGEPAEAILKAAKERKVDLIVLGIRSAARHLGAATHIARAIAHKIVAEAPCPVLTVRSDEAGSEGIRQ